MIEFLQAKLRYYRHCPGMALVEAPAAFHIHITPYYLYVEGLDRMEPPEWGSRFDDYDLAPATEDDFGQMAALPDRRVGVSYFHRQLEGGGACLVVRRQGRLAAFTWWNTARVTFPGHRFVLADDEAYLRDAYTCPEFRGQGLAFFARYHSYLELAKQGRTRLYSISESFNTPAVRFKKKVRAERVDWGLWVRWFDRWNWIWRRHNFRIASGRTGAG
jgi:GNAT superfamily N-acetyltransferase